LTRFRFIVANYWYLLTDTKSGHFFYRATLR